VWSCPDCDVALVLHRAAGFIACHHCGHREPVPDRCGECSSTSVARYGAGTERLEHELRGLLDGDGGFPVFRLDTDVLAGAGRAGAAPAAATGDGTSEAAGAEADVGGLLRRFEAADCGVLIGTQMVAKGHDFPDVTLGVVLDADATLRFPDFRAEERTFALIAQLAGRAGRGSDGRVLVQTIAPEARSIVHAARHDSDGFIAGELERRLALGYPPFSNLVRITCSATDARDAQSAASAVRERLVEAFGAKGSSGLAGSSPVGGAPPTGGRPDAGEPPVVLGPAALFRLRGRERRVLLIKAGERRPAVAVIGEAVQRAASMREHSDVSFSVDVDPH
jgi:primosomal protein N' (replication factor Y) (superfamily II helicase)